MRSMRVILLTCLVVGAWACTPTPNRDDFLFASSAERQRSLAAADGGPDTPFPDVPDADSGTAYADITDAVDTADAVDTVAADTAVTDTGPGETVQDKCGDGICQNILGESLATCPADCANCGNGKCEAEKGENSKNCKDDCCKCGDGVEHCDTQDCGETVTTCPTDCSACGDKACSPGESPKSCPNDCCGGTGGCGDGVCAGYWCNEDPISCGVDCGWACGDGTCDKGEKCPADCDTVACGNNKCEPGEKPETCPNDCQKPCGDCKCETGEDFYNCPVDCGFCGDGICSKCVLEDATTCTTDCK